MILTFIPDPPGMRVRIIAGRRQRGLRHQGGDVNAWKNFAGDAARRKNFCVLPALLSTEGSAGRMPRTDYSRKLLGGVE